MKKSSSLSFWPEGPRSLFPRPAPFFLPRSTCWRPNRPSLLLSRPRTLSLPACGPLLRTGTLRCLSFAMHARTYGLAPRPSSACFGLHRTPTPAPTRPLLPLTTSLAPPVSRPRLLPSPSFPFFPALLPFFTAGDGASHARQAAGPPRPHGRHMKSPPPTPLPSTTPHPAYKAPS